jgi:wobble nucleotide-excising tRNase
LFSIKGNIEKTCIVSDRIIVIDDPIPSLDSNVLFIVSKLVKKILKDCKEKRTGIKQVFVLTHNVYFHKEVTFKGSGESNTKEKSFWMVRKLNGKSTINKSQDNPIQTTYELLWSEIDDMNKINTATIFNTLRRILEYYSKILGGMKYEDCINEFGGEDKLVCRYLISWINDD